MRGCNAAKAPIAAPPACAGGTGLATELMGATHVNIRLLSLCTVLALPFGAASLAQAADPAPATAAVGHWLRDPQGRIIGSVRSLSPDGRTAEIMVGAYFQDGSYFATVPADALAIAKGRVTLRADTAMALNSRH